MRVHNNKHTSGHIKLPLMPHISILQSSFFTCLYSKWLVTWYSQVIQWVYSSLTSFLWISYAWIHVFGMAKTRLPPFLSICGYSDQPLGIAGQDMATPLTKYLCPYTTEHCIYYEIIMEHIVTYYLHKLSVCILATIKACINQDSL